MSSRRFCSFRLTSKASALGRETADKRKIAAIASILSGHLAAVSGGVGFCGGRISIPRLTQVWEEKLIFSFIFVCPVVIRQLTDLLSGFSVRRFETLMVLGTLNGRRTSNFCFRPDNFGLPDFSIHIIADFLPKIKGSYMI